MGRSGGFMEGTGGIQGSGFRGDEICLQEQKNHKNALFLVQLLSYREVRTYMGKARNTVLLWAVFLVSFSTTCRLISIELVKWTDGEKTKNKQREL
jgi:hypothetical protein